MINLHQDTGSLLWNLMLIVLLFDNCLSDYILLRHLNSIALNSIFSVRIIFHSNSANQYKLTWNFCIRTISDVDAGGIFGGFLTRFSETICLSLVLANWLDWREVICVRVFERSENSCVRWWGFLKRNCNLYMYMWLHKDGIHDLGLTSILYVVFGKIWPVFVNVTCS